MISLTFGALLQTISHVKIPDTVEIHDNASVFVIISLILGSISSLAVIFSAIFAYLQWKKSKYESKIQLVEKIREKLYDDKDSRHVIYLIDYSVSWYSAHFHKTEEPQGSVDKTLSIIEYSCYLLNQKILGEKEFDLIRYDADRIIQNYDMQAYMFNLYHWCKRINTRCSFLNIINYALDNGLWPNDFLDYSSERYPKHLNF